MEIKVTDLYGNLVDTIPCTPISILEAARKVKEKYPPGRYHATLIPY